MKRGSRRCRPERRIVRRSGDAARNPQRGRARRADLQHPRHSRRLHHRDHLLPQDIVHGRGGVSAADRDPAGARRARLGQFQSQHVPQRDDAAHHGDQLLRLDAADLCRARPADRGTGQIHRLQERRAGGRAGLRADPRHRRHFLHRAAVLQFRPDPQIRRGGACRHHHRAGRGAVAGAGVRRAVGPQREGLCGQVPERRRRRPGAAQFLLLDRGAHGQPARPVQPDRRAVRRRPRRDLRQSRAALPARRSGARQAAGGGGEQTGSTQADRRQSDRRADRIPQGRSRSIRRRRCRPSRTCTRRSRRQAGVGNVWSLETLRRWLAEKAGSCRRRDPEGICQPDPRASGAALHLRRAGCGGGLGPGARPRFQPAPACRRQARSRAGRRAQEASGLRDRRHRACRRSPRATRPT